MFLKAFDAGCTAMTGVEAVSNGVQSFKEPVVGSARLTLAMIVAILILILLGVAYLVSAYGITATEPGTPNYQSVLSLISAAVVGRGPFLFRDSRGHLIGPVLVCEYLICGFPSGLPCSCPGWFSSLFI
jgi:biotin transporter BioY